MHNVLANQKEHFQNNILTSSNWKQITFIYIMKDIAHERKR